MQGKGGSLSVQLNGLNQTLDLSSASSLLANLSGCHLGFTLTFTLKALTLCEGMYLLTSGGDLSTHSGLAVYYRRNWTYVAVSTEDYLWTLRLDKPVLEKFVDYEISWGNGVGLQAIVGQKTYRTLNYVLRAKPATSVSKTLYVGGPLPGTQGCYASLIFGNLQIFTAPKPVLDRLDVTTGQYIIKEFLIHHKIVYDFFRKVYNDKSN